MTRYIGRAVWALVAAAPLGCGGSNTHSTSVPSQSESPLSPAALSPAASANLSAALGASVEKGDAPGVVALVVGRDGVLFEGSSGSQSTATGTAMPADAIFNIASMTKPVTSVALLMLVEAGQVGLDDPVSKYLPGFDAPQVLTGFDAAGAPQTRPATQVMTVRHLLSHTSGIGYGFANASVSRMQQGRQLPEWQLPLLNEPGAAWHYSPGTRLIGQIVEQLSGQSLEAFLQEHIFQPLVMTDTSFAVPAEKLPRLPALNARGPGGELRESAQEGVPTTPTPPFTGDGGLYSTAQDYGRFMRMLLNHGTLGDAHVLEPGSVEMMGQNQIGALFVEQQEATIPTLSKPFPLGAGKDKFGLAVQITSPDSDDGAHRSAGSLAWAGIFNTEFWIDPQREIAATLLMQVLPFYDDGALRALENFEATLYGQLEPRR